MGRRTSSSGCSDLSADGGSRGTGGQGLAVGGGLGMGLGQLGLEGTRISLSTGTRGRQIKPTSQVSQSVSQASQPQRAPSLGLPGGLQGAGAAAQAGHSGKAGSELALVGSIAPAGELACLPAAPRPAGSAQPPLPDAAKEQPAEAASHLSAHLRDSGASGSTKKERGQAGKETAECSTSSSKARGCGTMGAVAAAISAAKFAKEPANPGTGAAATAVSAQAPGELGGANAASPGVAV